MTRETARILVVDAYAKEGRDDLIAGGAHAAGELYAQMLERLGRGALGCEIHYPAENGLILPGGRELAAYDGVAWTGSSLTIYHDDDRVTPQIDLARRAYDAGIPQFGSCWAVHVAVIAAGGRVAAHPEGREMGVARKLALTPAGRGHPIYDAKPGVFDGFISHDDEVTHLPANGVCLAVGRYCEVQAVSVRRGPGTFWAVQYHPEYDLREMARLMYCRMGKLIRRGFFADEEAALAHIDKLDQLHAHQGRTDLAWQLGLDADVLDRDVRELEVKAWLDHKIL